MRRRIHTIFPLFSTGEKVELIYLDDDELKTLFINSSFKTPNKDPLLPTSPRWFLLPKTKNPSHKCIYLDVIYATIQAIKNDSRIFEEEILAAIHSASGISIVAEFNPDDDYFQFENIINFPEFLNGFNIPSLSPPNTPWIDPDSSVTMEKTLSMKLQMLGSRMGPKCYSQEAF
jgi:hypothetical protein